MHNLWFHCGFWEEMVLCKLLGFVLTRKVPNCELAPLLGYHSVLGRPFTLCSILLVKSIITFEKSQWKNFKKEHIFSIKTLFLWPLLNTEDSWGLMRTHEDNFYKNKNSKLTWSLGFQTVGLRTHEDSWGHIWTHEDTY